MVYPKDFEHKIGFAPLRKLIKGKCETEMGKTLVYEMSFMANPSEIKKELGFTEEMRRLILSGISLPDFRFYDIARWLKEASAPGAFLSAEQLYQGALSFQTMNYISGFFLRDDSGLPDLRYLKKLFAEMPVFPSLENEIFRCIDKEGLVKDNASPRLFEIRRELESMSRSMHKIMRRILDSSVSQGIIDKDATPVIRDGRMVVPVSASNKRSLPGIVHDTSSTGKTVFIEPSEMVEAGNRLREIQIEEEQEIISILTSLTDLLRPNTDEITRGSRLLAKYDFIKAKAYFAIETGGELPVIETYPEIDWFHAVHPGLLLTLRAQGREVVAMNINLNEKDRILVISGPNAGGKSISLKTVGTVQYMMQCGLLPTLYSNSHMGIFTNIFIDIGDEQSMENDLSTYSSHLTNMKFFLRNANKKTLILADEIGSGTEPQIGSALAQSILSELGESGCFGVVTTHYQNLKIFAENEDGFLNGAMLYDRQLLRPTFQLSIGEPGSSFALEIARNIGLPSNVVERAKELVGSDYVDAERFTLDIQRDKRYWKKKRLEIKEKENKLNALLEKYEAKAEELKSQRNTIIKDARREAKEILQGANSQIERSIHEIRKWQADKEKSRQVRKELENYKKELDSTADSVEIPEALKPLKHQSKKNRKKQSESQSNSGSLKEFKEGDFVKLDNGGVVGTIIAIEGKKAEVAFGNLRTKVDITKLQAAEKPKQSTKGGGLITSTSDIESASRGRRLNFKPEIDVRGYRAEDALQALTYFLDDALQFNVGRVRILHGTGHGILRGLIREQLKSNSAVKDFHDEDVRLGGAGVTVVDLD